MKKNKAIYLLFALALLISVAGYFGIKINGCNKEGLSRDKALEVARWKLGVKFKDHHDAGKFLLVNEQFESDRSWLFVYRLDGCSVAIIIDACGKADFGGISRECL